MAIKTFYYAAPFNLPTAPNGGAEIARRVIRMLEQELNERCTSRWPYSGLHYEQLNVKKVISATDLIDITRADYVIAVPLTGTARGCHVEMGLAIALDKPLYIYRPFLQEGTAFDEFGYRLAERLEDKIDAIIKDYCGGVPKWMKKHG